MSAQKILIIRMQTVGDVAAIGVPALRHFQNKYPDAEFTFLTHAEGVQIIKHVDRKVQIMSLPDNEWPENIIPAMEYFLGLAEDIVGVGYDEIINLDTVFMPCFLARFLKDAGENVIGNTMNISVQELIEKFQLQQLKPEYVQDASLYMDSSYFTMATWHTQWWKGGFIPDHGYPEYYLSRACGLSDFSYNNQLDIDPAESLTEIKNTKKIIAIATQTTAEQQGYPYTKQLIWSLEDLGYHVIHSYNSATSIRQQLSTLKQADLLLTLPNAAFWLAKSVQCPTLVLLGDMPAETLMSEHVIEQENLSDVSAESLVNIIQDIVTL